MSQAIAILFVLLIVLTIVAVVGHGIWVFMAWFFRTIFGVVPGDAQRTMRCPRCKGSNVAQGRCQSCGLILYQNEPTPTTPTTTRTLTPADERLIVTRHVRRLYDAGAIDGATCATIIAAMTPSKTPIQTPVSANESAAATWIDAPHEREVTSDAAPQAPIASASGPAGPPIRVQSIEPAPETVPFEEWSIRPIDAARPVAPPPLPPALVRPPKPPRKPMSELLAAFMEESNIRWGELVGGLLIVGCSIALVFTFWDWIAVRPWFKFFLFTAITGAVFATGLYTEHRWRLPNTSRGLLLIATLLVPLNFLAIAAFSRDVETLAIARVGGELLAITLFTWLVWWAGKVITPGWQMTLAAGVLGASVCQVIVHRFAPSASPAAVVALACLPLLFYLGAVAAMIRSAWRWESITRVETNRLFTFLGAVSFAAIIPLGLLAFNVPDFRIALERIAPAVGLYGLPALSTGLFLWKRLENDKQLIASRTAGTSITVLGALALVGSMVLAWPNPTSLLCASLLNFALLTAAAMLFAIPAGHLLALPCAVLAYLLGFHIVAGNVTDLTTIGLARTLLSAASGAALLPVVALIGLASGYLKRRNLDSHARFYGLVCACTAGLSLALVSWYGFGRANDHGAVWVYATYAAAALVAARYVPRAETVWAASILLAATLAQAMVFRFPVADRMIDRWTLAALTHASAMTGLILVGKSWARFRETLDRPLADAAIASSIIAASLIGIAVFAPHGVSQHARDLTIMTGWLAAIWLVISVANVLPMVFTAFQGALVASFALAVTSLLQARPWYQSQFHPLGDPWTWQAHGVAFGLLSLIWIGVRFFAQRRIRLAKNDELVEASTLERSDRASRLLWPAWPTVDWCITWLLFAAMLAVSMYATWPGIASELSAQSTPVTYPQHDLTLHEHARGWGAWLMLSVTIAALLGTLRETNSPKYLWAVVTALTCACALFAARWQDASASASALRWALAGYLLFTSAVVWGRDHLRLLGRHWSDVRTLTLSLTIAPILALTIYPALATLSGTDLVGPATDTFFGSITSAASYLVPLALVTLVLVGHALRERSAGFAFSAGLVLNLTVTLAYALWLTQNNITIGTVEQIRLVQFNVIASALFALAWAATWRFSKLTEDRDHALPPLLLQLHVAIAGAAMLVLILPAAWRLYLAPQLDPATIAEVGNVYGWAAVLLTCAAAATMFWPIYASAINAFGGAATLVAPLAAFTLCRGDSTGWTGFHALLIAFAAAGWAVLGLNWLAQLKSQETIDALDDSPEADRSPLVRTRRSATIWASLFGFLTLALAFRALDADPASPTWTLAGIVASSLLAVGLSIQTLRSEWLYPAGLLLNAAATITWQHYTRTRRPFVPFLELAQVNALCLACTGLATLALELFVLRPMRSQVVRRGFAPFHHFASILALILVSALAFFLMFDAPLKPILTWSTLAATLVLLTATLWDEDANYSIKALYTLGLAALASAFPLWYRNFGDILEMSPLALAAYSLLWGFLFTQRTALARFAESTGIPLRRHWPSDRAGWLAGVTIVLALLVSLLAFGNVLNNASLFMRLAMGTSVIAIATALGLMAGLERPAFTHYAALLLAAFGVTLWGWAWIDPTRPMLLERLVILMLALAGMTAVYAVGLVKLLRLNDVWTRAARNLVPLLAMLAGGCLLGILIVEVNNYRPTGTPIATPAAIAVVLAFLGLAAGCIVCAVVPGRDPFDLSERGRTIYVYAAEVLLILLFAHCKLVWPDLLQIGIWRRYWPIIIVLVSFLGVGLAEVFRRQNRIVLAEPLERSGAIIPIIPIITFFMFDSHRGTTSYAHVLFLTGIVYGALAVMRKSFLFGVLAALAGNGGLWYLLHHTQNLGFTTHPQLWLIPAALSVLAAAQLNKDRLSTNQMRVIRYITMMIVYASSTADILISNLGEAPHLPLILALLSVAGVMLGIMLRVQSFLFLGTTFLLVSIAAMIQYATLQVGGSWPWLIAGILLGAAIVTLFALFEKKRNDMLALVEGLKEWQG